MRRLGAVHVPARHLRRFGLLCATLMFAAGLAGRFIMPAYAGGYATPTAGQSPHGSYSDATDKCKVCHAVHNASTTDDLLGGSTQTLLRTKRGWPDAWPRETPDSGNPCVYCHIVGTWSITKVYGGGLANYTSNLRNNHDDSHRSQGWGTANYAGCMSCHSVHGANVVPGYETEIVRDNPGTYFSTPVTNLTDFCRDCHDDYIRNPWRPPGSIGLRCGFCHNGLGGMGGLREPKWPYYTQSRDGATHIMTTTLTGNNGTTVAWSDSSDCRDCHEGGTGTMSNSFPHYTSGAQFLDDAYVTKDTNMDRVCVNCHVEGGDGGAYTTGVGKTF